MLERTLAARRPTSTLQGIRAQIHTSCHLSTAGQDFICHSWVVCLISPTPVVAVPSDVHPREHNLRSRMLSVPSLRSRAAHVNWGSWASAHPPHTNPSFLVAVPLSPGCPPGPASARQDRGGGRTDVGCSSIWSWRPRPQELKGGTDSVRRFHSCIPCPAWLRYLWDECS